MLKDALFKKAVFRPDPVLDLFGCKLFKYLERHDLMFLAKLFSAYSCYRQNDSDYGGKNIFQFCFGFMRWVFISIRLHHQSQFI